MKTRWTFLKIPDWVIYLAGAALILWIATHQREDADAPPAPPPVPGEEAAPLAPDSPFGAVARRTSQSHAALSGAAFSISDRGVWLTAAHVVRDCSRVVVMVAEGRGVSAAAAIDPQVDIAILTTVGGAPALPLFQGAKPDAAIRGFHPGFPRGAPGEVTSRFVGRDTLPAERRGDEPQAVLAWAETGRTAGAEGALYGLSGAPVMDRSGRVIGVTIGEAPRRGRIYTTGPASLARALETAGVAPAPYVEREPTTIENYGRVADGLRRQLSVAQVFCFRR